MKKIATHNSVTGEAGKGILSWLVAPFSKCQSKTLEQQYNAGVRLFDMRVWRDKHGVWRCGHGLWEAKKTFYECLVLDLLRHSDTYMTITFERGTNGEAMLAQLLNDIPLVKRLTEVKRVIYVACKRPQWRIVKAYDSHAIYPGYKILDGSTWHTYLPIPWLWKMIYYPHPTFHETFYTMVDFV